MGRGKLDAVAGHRLRPVKRPTRGHIERLLLCPGDQLRQLHRECVGDLEQVRVGRVALAALDPPDVGPVDSGAFGECFLRELQVGAAVTDCAPKGFVRRGADGHAGDTARLMLIRLQPMSSRSTLGDVEEHEVGRVAAGIDLSGRTTGTTAIAWLEAGRGKPWLTAIISEGLRGTNGDRRILEAIQARPAEVVALDAPLELPHAVSCRKPRCRSCFPADGSVPSYGRRAIDGPDAWAAIGHTEKAPMPTVMLAGIAFRAIYLRRLLKREGFRVIETWPMGVYRLLARGRERGSGGPLDGAARRELLAEGMDRLDEVAGARPSVDELDAVAAAYAGWSYLTGRARVVAGPRDEGEIVIPA